MEVSYSEQMLSAIQNEALSEAQLALTQALANDHEDELAFLGDQLLAIGFLAEAKQVFSELLARFPEHEELYLSLAEVAIDDDQIDEAFEYLEKIDSDSPLYPETLLITADLYQVLGIPEVSEAKLNEAAKLLPNEPLIQFALAELYFTTDRFGEAATLYQMLLKAEIKEFSEISLQERLGTALSMEGQFESAIEYLEAALAENITENRLFQTAFVYLQLKENQQAIHYLQELRALNPQYVSLYLYLAEALQEEELLQEAQEVIEDGIHENPYQIDFYHFASENAYRMGDILAAEQFLQKSLESAGKSDETLEILSNLYLKAARYEDVILAIEQMENPEQPQIYWNLAKANNELEEFEKAADYYEQAAQELHHEPEFMKEYGIFLRDEGRTSEALLLLTHYLQHEPGDLEVQSIIEALH
ncbi:MAG: tetratricopeptide repeat protein [Enterococcus sp.]